MLLKLLKIIIPSWRSKEFVLLLFHSGFLLARTAASVYFATLDGQIVQALVPLWFSHCGGEWEGEGVYNYHRLVAHHFCAHCFCQQRCNVFGGCDFSQLKYLQNRLSISFRTRLTEHVHREVGPFSFVRFRVHGEWDVLQAGELGQSNS
jgi:ATP-binding cassette, subfamily D (ALD), peroxisomal long-chain fatty acid import protein